MNDQLIFVNVDTLKRNVCAFFFENYLVWDKVGNFKVFLIHEANVKLPQGTIDCPMMLYKYELGLLNRGISQFTKSKLRFKENSKAVGLALWVVTHVDPSKLTGSLEFNHCGLHLDYCLNCCISTPLIKFCFSNCEYKDGLSLARLPNYSQIQKLFISDLCLHDVKRFERLHFAILKSFIASMPYFVISVGEERLEWWVICSSNPSCTNSSKSLNINYSHQMTFKMIVNHLVRT